MDESDFWLCLEYRICSEFEGMPSKELRALWCDGFSPVQSITDDPAPQIVGRAWIGPGGQDEWEFTLFLRRPVGSREEIDWASLLPPENTTRWLGLDLQGKRLHITIDPSAAVPDPD